jgi:cell wall-associated NlpC family hydrolase
VRLAPRPFSRTARLALAVASVATLATVATSVVSAEASAATPRTVHAALSQAYQHRDGSVTVAGFAWDTARPRAAVAVCVVTAGACVRRVRADDPSPVFSREHRLGGGHAFRVTLPATRAAEVVLRSGPTVLARRAVSTPGARVVAVARRQVGHARYTDGGSSPAQGFDCSGLTLYAYRTAGVATLPHDAEAQRHVAHMRTISRAQARPGDLVFYFSGGPAYHVAIYAGHGMQYAAATPRDGIRYQAIWSSAVEFRTDWH